MNFELKLKLCRYLQYFNKGAGLTNYVKYLIAFFGLASRDVSNTLWLAAGYLIACFFIGFLWYKYNWITAEIEVNNRFNLFVKEMRKNYRK